MMLSPIDQVLSRLHDPKQTPTGWMARCPAHDDRKASLSISQTDDGTVLVKCHAGCSADEVVEAIGLKLRDLFPSGRAMHSRRESAGVCLWQTARAGLRTYVARYGPHAGYHVYTDAARVPQALVARWYGSVPRTCWLHRVPAGWRPGLPAPPRPLYRLAALVETTSLVVLVEDELAADDLAALRIEATCCPGGLAAVLLTDFTPLRGRAVLLVQRQVVSPHAEASVAMRFAPADCLALVSAAVERLLDAGVTEVRVARLRDWAPDQTFRAWLRQQALTPGDPWSLYDQAVETSIYR